MDFDFAIVLVALTALCGVIWLIDRIFLAPGREEKLRAARLQAEGELPEAVVKELAREPGWVDTGKSMFPVLLIVLVVRSFLIEPFQIPSGSMEPTLKVGDFILVNKYHYGLRLPILNSKFVPMNEPQRGDVIVFKYPKQPAVNYIKRVVGVPGDVIRYQNKTLYVNGVEQTQVLIEKVPELIQGQMMMTNIKTEKLDGVEHQIKEIISRPSVVGEIVVKEGHYFVMGDNRDNSNDSRAWGSVPDELVVGKAFAVWMYWNEFFSAPDFSDVRVIQ